MRVTNPSEVCKSFSVEIFSSCLRSASRVRHGGQEEEEELPAQAGWRRDLAPHAWRRQGRGKTLPANTHVLMEGTLK